MSRALLACAAGAAFTLSLAPIARAAGDAAFVTKAVQGDASEVTLGAMAARKASSPEVRRYGRMLESDHARARDQALALARSLGASPEVKPTGEARREARKLDSLSGPDFDREFVRYMTHDHQRDIRDFEREARKRQTPAARLARDTLPTLHKHLEVALQLARGRTG